jgi:hypothetical protein
MQNETEEQRIEREIAEYHARVPRVPDVLGVL